MSDYKDSEMDAIDGEVNVGSLKHGTIQSNIAYLLKLNTNKKIHAVTDLSLDISQYDLSKYDLHAKNELEPDIAGYFTLPPIPDGKDDLVNVTQMPDLAIEILSPRQSKGYLHRKIWALFAIGVRSCWLVEPTSEYISVYSSPKTFKNFDCSDTEVIDENLGIHIPIKEIFEY